MAVLDNRTLVSTVAIIFLAWLASKTVWLLKDRQRVKKFPGPPMHPIFGHLLAVGKTAAKLPTRIHPHTLPSYLQRDFDLPSVFLMDARPFATLSLVIADPEIAQQVLDSGLPKHPSIASVVNPLAGEMNMMTTEGAIWKKWRNIFNPGFSVQQIVSQVPIMVECGEAFIGILHEHASAKRVFRLEEESTKVTIDVIGKVICDHDFKSLTTDNEFVTTMRNILAWLRDPQSINPLHLYNPLRPILLKYYKSKMDRYIGKVLDERFAVRDLKQPNKSRKKTGIDLALEEYSKQQSGQEFDAQHVGMDAEFRTAAIHNLLILLFAGHDTTASTLCYCYHLLQQHPAELAKVRQELDTVFGTGVSAGDQLKTTPYLVNQLDYTLAVIKETLRLWPPASSGRIGRKGYFIKDPTTGEFIDTEGALLWVVSMAIQRDARIWGPDVDEFKPERFMPENAGKLPPNAWRPFEKGPRNCIGQEVALIELKVILAMTLREFDFKAAYDELGSLMNDGTLWAKDSTFRQGPQEAFGERMHQILLAAGKPSEGMPARVFKREK